MNTRQEKIRFLKGLSKGERNISELIPFKSIYLFKEEGQDYYEDSSKSGTKWTFEDIKNHKLKHPQDHIVIIKKNRTAKICLSQNLNKNQ